jgi:hypothetical protein
MYFGIIGKIEHTEPIAAGGKIRDIMRIRKKNGTITKTKVNEFDARISGSTAWKTRIQVTVEPNRATVIEYAPRSPQVFAI